MAAVDPIRARLEQLLARDGVSMATLSRALGHNDAWIQQYLRRGTPKALGEQDRGEIARFFGVDDSELGADASDRHRCRLCTANDLDGLAEELAERMWTSRRDASEADIGAWSDAGDYWHRVFRADARAAIEMMRR